MAEAAAGIFAAVRDAAQNGAPLYLQLRRTIEDAVRSGILGPGDALPSERDIALKADVSRVTVRKAVQDLVKQGLLVQRRGSGTFVARRMERVEQSLSRLTSFTEDMARRGMSPSSAWVERGIFSPSPEEVARAREVVEAFAAADAEGKGAIRVGYRMVERLHLEAAHRLLARHEAASTPPRDAPI